MFRNSDVQQPPDVEAAGEKKVEGLKSKILRLLAHYKAQDKPNVTSAVRMNLNDIKQENGPIIKQSDKCKGLVMMNQEDYVGKANKITDT